MSGRPKSARATGLYAEMDLTGVVSTLESHWVVLDAELSEIRKDFATLKALSRKHGDFWSRPMAQLKKLRTQKENLLKECAHTLHENTTTNAHMPKHTHTHVLPTHPTQVYAHDFDGRIKFQMELFNLHIQQGRDLCSKLSSVASVIKTPPAQLQSQLAIEVVSPILANSQKCVAGSRSLLWVALSLYLATG
jgi:hypothetical protein